MSPPNIWRTTLNYLRQTLFIVGQMWFLTQSQQVGAEEAWSLLFIPWKRFFKISSNILKKVSLHKFLEVKEKLKCAKKLRRDWTRWRILSLFLIFLTAQKVVLIHDSCCIKKKGPELHLTLTSSLNYLKIIKTLTTKHQNNMSIVWQTSTTFNPLDFVPGKFSTCSFSCTMLFFFGDFVF